MGNNTQIFLKCKGNEIFVECKIIFDESVNTFIFSVNALLSIDDISSNTNVELQKNSEWKHNPYTPAQQEYTISAQAAFSAVTIKKYGVGVMRLRNVELP